MERGRRAVGVLFALGVTAGALASCSSGSPPGAPVASVPTVTATGDDSPSGSPTPTASPTGSPSGSSAGASAGSSSTAGTPAGSSGSTTPAPASSGAGDGMLRLGASGPDVLALQHRLADLGYWLGAADGKYGDLTVQAVTALQKAAGLDRDGVLGPRTKEALDQGLRPSAHSTAGHVVEIDKKRQLLLVVDGGRVSRVLNASTGSGAWYAAPDGHVGHAVTPAGHYAVFRSVDAWDASPLGHLYRPRYFTGGIAVHGYPSVPSVPASHGCVRVSLPAMDMIWAEGLLPRSGAVWVY